MFSGWVQFRENREPRFWGLSNPDPANMMNIMKSDTIQDSGLRLRTYLECERFAVPSKASHLDEGQS